MNEDRCPSPELNTVAECRAVHSTVEERLMRRKRDLEADIENINAALLALQANP